MKGIKHPQGMKKTASKQGYTPDPKIPGPGSGKKGGKKSKAMPAEPC